MITGHLLQEPALRRADYSEGARVILLDGQPWTLATPGVEVRTVISTEGLLLMPEWAFGRPKADQHDRERMFRIEYDSALARWTEAAARKDLTSRLSEVIRIARLLLGWN